jgi:hypothetical protein
MSLPCPGRSNSQFKKMILQPRKTGKLSLICRFFSSLSLMSQQCSVLLTSEGTPQKLRGEASA